MNPDPSLSELWRDLIADLKKSIGNVKPIRNPFTNDSTHMNSVLNTTLDETATDGDPDCVQVRGGEPVSGGTAAAVRGSEPRGSGKGKLFSDGPAVASQFAQPTGSTGMSVSGGAAAAYR